MQHQATEGSALFKTQGACNTRLLQCFDNPRNAVHEDPRNTCHTAGSVDVHTCRHDSAQVAWIHEDGSCLCYLLSLHVMDMPEGATHTCSVCHPGADDDVLMSFNGLAPCEGCNLHSLDLADTHGRLISELCTCFTFTMSGLHNVCIDVKNALLGNISNDTSVDATLRRTRIRCRQNGRRGFLPNTDSSNQMPSHMFRPAHQVQRDRCSCLYCLSCTGCPAAVGLGQTCLSLQLPPPIAPHPHWLG